MKHVRQFHVEAHRVTSEFSLGKYDDGRDARLSLPTGAALPSGLSPHVFAASYVNGTGNRATDIRVRCAAKNEHAMLSIEEPSVHKYVVEFSTPLACELNCAFARETDENSNPSPNPNPNPNPSPNPNPNPNPTLTLTRRARREHRSRGGDGRGALRRLSRSAEPGAGGGSQPRGGGGGLTRESRAQSLQSRAVVRRSGDGCVGLGLGRVPRGQPRGVAHTRGAVCSVFVVRLVWSRIGLVGDFIYILRQET